MKMILVALSLFFLSCFLLWANVKVMLETETSGRQRLTFGAASTRCGAIPKPQRDGDGDGDGGWSGCTAPEE